MEWEYNENRKVSFVDGLMLKLYHFSWKKNKNIRQIIIYFLKIPQKSLLITEGYLDDGHIEKMEDAIKTVKSDSFKKFVKEMERKKAEDQNLNLTIPKV